MIHKFKNWMVSPSWRNSSNISSMGGLMRNIRELSLTTHIHSSIAMVMIISDIGSFQVKMARFAMVHYHVGQP
jgi:hypothetical protein